MSSKAARIVSARALIKEHLDRNKRLDFKSMEPEIRMIIGTPGASYDDVVTFFAECGIVLHLDSVHKFCIPRNIKPPLPGAAEPAKDSAPLVLRRRSGLRKVDGETE